MARRDWNKIAHDQFKSMPKDFQDAWQDLRAKIYRG